ncbi:MAG: tetratricopeptide repeat protein [Bacteroidota bacterium]
MIKLIISLCSLPCFAFQDITENPEESIERLIKLKQYDSALQVIKAYSTSNRLTPNLIKLKADAYYYLGNYTESAPTYLQAAETALNEEVSDHSKISDYYGNAAYTFSKLGLVERSLSYNKIAQKHAFLSKDSAKVAGVYANIGVDYEHLGDYSKAFLHFDSAYLLDKALKDTLSMTSDLNNIGYLFVKWKKYEQALEFYGQSLALAEILGEKEMIARRLNNIGMALLLKGELNLAEEKLRRSLAIHTAMNDSLNVARRLVNLGELASRRKNFDKAISLKKEALLYFEASQELFVAVEGRLSLAKTFSDAGNYDLAIKEYTRIINVAENNQLAKILLEALAGIQKAYAEIGDFEKAHSYQSKFISVNDIVFSEKSNELIQEMQVKYDVEKKESEIELLNAKNKLTSARLTQKKREQYGGALAATVVLGLLCFALWSLRKNYRLKEKLLITEIDQLRERISETIKQSEIKQNEAIDFEMINQSLSNPLSQRELEIVGLVKSELTNRQIAEKAFVSVNTVKFHLRNIYEKLNVGNREQAIAALVSAKKKMR